MRRVVSKTFIIFPSKQNPTTGPNNFEPAIPALVRRVAHVKVGDALGYEDKCCWTVENEHISACADGYKQSNISQPFLQFQFDEDTEIAQQTHGLRSGQCSKTSPLQPGPWRRAVCCSMSQAAESAATRSHLKEFMLEDKLRGGQKFEDVLLGQVQEAVNKFFIQNHISSEESLSTSQLNALAHYLQQDNLCGKSSTFFPETGFHSAPFDSCWPAGSQLRVLVVSSEIADSESQASCVGTPDPWGYVNVGTSAGCCPKPAGSETLREVATNADQRPQAFQCPIMASLEASALASACTTRLLGTADRDVVSRDRSPQGSWAVRANSLGVASCYRFARSGTKKHCKGVATWALRCNSVPYILLATPAAPPVDVFNWYNSAYAQFAADPQLRHRASSASTYSNVSVNHSNNSSSVWPAGGAADALLPHTRHPSFAEGRTASSTIAVGSGFQGGSTSVRNGSGGLPPTAGASAASSTMGHGAFAPGAYGLYALDDALVVEVGLRDHFALAPATPEYLAELAKVPQTFVGFRAQLLQLAEFLANAVVRNYASQGLDVPPWRSRDALLARWVTGPSLDEVRRHLYPPAGGFSQAASTNPTLSVSESVCCPPSSTATGGHSLASSSYTYTTSAAGFATENAHRVGGGASYARQSSRLPSLFAQRPPSETQKSNEGAQQVSSKDGRASTTTRLPLPEPKSLLHESLQITAAASQIAVLPARALSSKALPAIQPTRTADSDGAQTRVRQSPCLPAAAAAVPVAPALFVEAGKNAVHRMGLGNVPTMTSNATNSQPTRNQFQDVDGDGSVSSSLCPADLYDWDSRGGEIQDTSVIASAGHPLEALASPSSVDGRRRQCSSGYMTSFAQLDPVRLDDLLCESHKPPPGFGQGDEAEAFGEELLLPSPSVLRSATHHPCCAELLENLSIDEVDLDPGFGDMEGTVLQYPGIGVHVGTVLDDGDPVSLSAQARPRSPTLAGKQGLPNPTEFAAPGPGNFGPFGSRNAGRGAAPEGRSRLHLANDDSPFRGADVVDYLAFNRDRRHAAWGY